MNRGLRNELALMAGVASVGLLLGQRRNLAAAFGLTAAALKLLPSKNYSLKNRSVVITGGSRGLGLALAENALYEGAKVTIIARDRDELHRAQALLDKIPHGEVLAVPADVTEPEQLRRAFEAINSRFGGVDVLINNAGSITVGPYETMEKEDFESLLDLQIRAVINAVHLALPSFRRKRGGRIVNISSIGGKFGVPHMSTYTTAKYALAGLSETLHAELAVDNVRVTTVFPGLMRTGSPIQAVFKGDHEREYGWFAAGDVMPVISVPAQYAACKIIDALKAGDSELVFPIVMKAGVLGRAIFPETYAFALRTAARFMPKGDSRDRKTGAESQGWLEKQFWYKPLQSKAHKAESEYNQSEKADADFNLGVQ